MSENIDIHLGRDRKNTPEATEPTVYRSLGDQEDERKKSIAVADIRRTLAVFDESLLDPSVLTNARNVSILEENLGDLSLEWQARITTGGIDHHNEKGETVGRVFTGNQVGRGGLGSINEVYFARSGQSKLERGVGKTHLDATENPYAYRAFLDEKNNAQIIQKILEDYPAEPGARNLARPLLVSNESVVYEMIENDQGESLNLRATMEQSSVRDWLLQLAGGVEGLAYLQRHGLNHFDFKPDNIVLGKNGEGVLLDYGAARPHGRIEMDRISITPKFTDIQNILLQDLTQVHDICDKFAVGMSLRDFLLKKGFLEPEKNPAPISHKLLALKEPSSEAMKELHALYVKLSEVGKNFESDSANYVPLDQLADRLRAIAKMFPEIRGAPNRDKNQESHAAPTIPAAETLPIQS